MSETSETLSTDTKSSRPWLFPPGNKANPAGRPKGSRNRLGEDFLSAMADDFEAYGAAAIEAVRTERPQDYLKVIASILPKIINVKTDELENQTDDELRAAYAREVRKLIAFGVAVGVEINAGGDVPNGTVTPLALPALQ